MALSNKERKEKREIIHVMKSLFESDIDMSEDIISEAVSSGSMTDLKEIELFIEGKTPPYYGTKKSPSINTEAIEISLLFYSSKYTKVEEGKNYITFGFTPIADEDVVVRVVDDFSSDIGSLYNQAEKDSSGDGTKLSDIMKECNAEEIYNIYKRDALDIIKSRIPTVHALFTGGTVTHRMNKKIGTLRVIFYPRFNKFAYEYNPDFILKSALDEWFRNRDTYKYDSLKDCYCYVLAFVISHEMMHLIHHNNTSNIDVGFEYDRESMADTYRTRELSNIYTDSFINCRLSRALKNVRGVKCIRGLAPVLSNGIGESVNIRAEHNVGFNEFKNLRDLVKKIVDVISDITKEKYRDISIGYDFSGDMIKNYAKADVFIKIKVVSSYSPLRLNSGIFQRFINEVSKIISSGRVYSGLLISDEEKETDKEILPKGTLVQVKGSPNICSIDSYNESDGKYTLMETEVINTKREDMGNGAVLCTPVYSTKENIFGRKRRRDIRPFNPETDGSWVEQSGEREKKTKLDPKGNEGDNAQNSENTLSNQAPVFHIGDIVWVKRLKKFGKIISITDGNFELEEMEEVGVKVLDDSDFEHSEQRGEE